MTPADMLRIHCRALGFLAVLLRDAATDQPIPAQQMERATAIAGLIKSFCCLEEPEAPAFWNIIEHRHDAAIDHIIESFKTEIVVQGHAYLPEDRHTLLQMYDRLHQRQLRRQEQHFFAEGSDNMIANRVLRLIDEEIAHDQSGN